MTSEIWKVLDECLDLRAAELEGRHHESVDDFKNAKELRKWTRTSGFLQCNHDKMDIRLVFIEYPDEERPHQRMLVTFELQSTEPVKS